jgi:hypothetical protein
MKLGHKIIKTVIFMLKTIHRRNWKMRILKHWHIYWCRLFGNGESFVKFALLWVHLITLSVTRLCSAHDTMINECGAVGRMRTSSLINCRIERRTQNHLEQKIGSGVEVGSNIDHAICCGDNGYNIAGAHTSVTHAGSLPRTPQNNNNNNNRIFVT